MGIFSFGKKDAESSEQRGARSRAARSGERRGEGFERAPAAARTRRSGSVGQEALLDPTLPEKQRARRRLVGAIALVMAAIVILPMVLDSHPKPVSSDIAISIPNQDEGTSYASSGRSKTSGQAANQAQNQDDESDLGAAAPDSPPPAVDAASTPSVPQAAVKSNAVATSPVVPIAPVRNQAAPAERSTDAKAAPKPATSSTATKAVNAAAMPPTATAPGSHYVVQLGSAPNERAAQEWITKLKNAGVPAYIERAKQADGSERFMLRAGPFADRTSAQKAVRKVNQAGLSQAGR